MKASELRLGDTFLRTARQQKGFELVVSKIGTAFVYTVYASDKSLEGPDVLLSCDVELVQQ